MLLIHGVTVIAFVVLCVDWDEECGYELHGMTAWKNGSWDLCDDYELLYLVGFVYKIRQLMLMLTVFFKCTIVCEIGV